MNNSKIEEMLKDTKAIVNSGKRTEKIVAKLVTIGYVVVKDGNSHHHLTHSLAGNAKFTIGCSPSCSWGNNFVSQVRHAIWKNVA